ncbi:hypothetical protein TTHERM_00047730 (macronuclear) [Tetrahymena thermophila SB210]|uniref:Uncharacterized protein n=1 Tax=Tetrahymena thermophila (strain SB210) TaxID=312017 RepID=Q23DB8_TETTS|nr:hypothetical protein TTHERM_00047730 [Tetrahymena thermophila SB210]EAR94705.2 hypothetical protein TTHERM_00047730 [Tetrahymena thermophila SB210]|eukprot:XP_001014768.2 hypothetical protein TTHERM_00047730 [Tetrahymena thermophila SB210]
MKKNKIKKNQSNYKERNIQQKQLIIIVVTRKLQNNYFLQNQKHQQNLISRSIWIRMLTQDKKSTKSMIAVKHQNRVQQEENQADGDLSLKNNLIKSQVIQRTQIEDGNNNTWLQVSQKQDNFVRLSKLNEEEAAVLFENRKKELFENLMTQIKRNSSNSTQRKKSQNQNSLNSSIQKERSSSVGKNRSNNSQSQSQQQQCIKNLIRASSLLDNNQQQTEQKVYINPGYVNANKQKQENSQERVSSANISSVEKKFIIYNEKFIQKIPVNISSEQKRNQINSDRENGSKSNRSKADLSSNNCNNKDSKLKTNYALLNQYNKQIQKQKQNEFNTSNKRDSKMSANSINQGNFSTVFVQKNNFIQNGKVDKQRELVVSERIGVSNSSHSITPSNKNKTPSKITSSQHQQKKQIDCDQEFGQLLQNGSKNNLINSKRMSAQITKNTKKQQTNNMSSSSNLSQNLIRSNSVCQYESQPSRPYSINLIQLSNVQSQQSSPKRGYLKTQRPSEIANENQNQNEQALFFSQSSNNSISNNAQQGTNNEICSINSLKKQQQNNQLNYNSNKTLFLKSNSDRPQSNMLSYAKIYNSLISQHKGNQEINSTDVSPIEKQQMKNLDHNFYSANQDYHKNLQNFKKQESDSSTQAFDSDQDKQAAKKFQQANIQQLDQTSSKQKNLSYVKLQSKQIIQKQLEKQKIVQQEISLQKQQLIQNLQDLNEQIGHLERTELKERKSSFHLDTSPFSKLSTQEQSIRDMQLIQNTKQSISYSSLHQQIKQCIGTNQTIKSRSKEKFQSSNLSNSNSKLTKPFQSQANTPKSKKKIQFSNNVSINAVNTGEKTPLKSILVNGKNSSHSIDRAAIADQTQERFSDSIKQKDLTLSINLQSQLNLSQYKVNCDQEDDEKKYYKSQNDNSNKSLNRINSAHIIDFRPKAQAYKSKAQLQQVLVRRISENENLYSDIKNKVISTNELKTLKSEITSPHQALVNGFQTQKSQRDLNLDYNKKFNRNSSQDSMFYSQVYNNNNNNSQLNDILKSQQATAQFSQRDRQNQQKFIS